MEPRPGHSGGSVSANAGAELAALISARGTSDCARRSIMFGTPVAAGVWQTETFGPKKGGDVSTAVARAPASVTMFPASGITSAAPPSAAAPTETSSLCDRVNVAIAVLQNRAEEKSAEIEIERVALSRNQRRLLKTNFERFPAF